MYPWGASFSWEMGAVTKSTGGTHGTFKVGTHPAGASPYGLMDMAGNVWEWCADWYHASYYDKSPERNPQGPAQDQWRVARGGCFTSGALCFHCTHRGYKSPHIGNDHFGMRLCRDTSA